MGKPRALPQETGPASGQSEELRRISASLRAEVPSDREARRAALNLIEDAVTARRAQEVLVEELRQVRDELSSELAATRQLQALASKLLHDDDTNRLYEDIVESAIQLMHSEMGSLQIFDEKRNDFCLLTSRGFHPEAIKRWERVSAACSSVCGRALKEGARVFVKDIESCDFITGAEDLAPFRLCGIRSVLTVPLVSRSGRIVGAMSNHWREPHEPQEREMLLMDIFARQAADALERRQHQEAFKELQARHAFLLALSDELRPLTDPLEVQLKATHLLGERLGVSRAVYARVESREDSDYFTVSHDFHAPGLPSLVGRYRASDFGDNHFIGNDLYRTASSPDVSVDSRITDIERLAYDRLGLRAFIAVPLIKNGKRVAILSVLHTSPRDWKDYEIALVEETAERTWAAVERAEVECALREAKAAADSANRSKDRVLAVLSHELRTPLTPVLLITGAMMQDPTISEDVKENLAMIRRNVELETRLIDDLLDVTRLNSGKVRLKPRPLDLNEAVEHACGICHPTWDERQIQVECEYDSRIGQITADAVRVQQVLWNILKNAIKFTMKGGRIRVSTHRLDDERCEIRIRDTGIGIRPEVLPRIFDVFDQGDPDITTRFGGLGLGLAISKALVELHGGSIRAESDGVGEGACFIVELPVNPPIADTEETTPPPDAITPRPKHLAHVQGA